MTQKTLRYRTKAGWVTKNDKIAAVEVDDNFIAMEEDLANTTDPAKGAGMVGVSPIPSTPTFTEVLTGTLFAVLGGLIGRIKMLFSCSKASVFWFMSPAQIADVLSGTPLLDHHAVLQSAADACVGKSLVFPAGSYNTSAEIVLGNGTEIVFQQGAVLNLKTKNINGFIATGKNNVAIKNAKIVSAIAGDAAYSAAIHFVNCTDCLVEKAILVGMSWAGVLLNNTSKTTVTGITATGWLGTLQDSADICVYQNSNNNMITKKLSVWWWGSRGNDPRPIYQ